MKRERFYGLIFIALSFSFSIILSKAQGLDGKILAVSMSPAGEMNVRVAGASVSEVPVQITPPEPIAPDPAAMDPAEMDPRFLEKIRKGGFPLPVSSSPAEANEISRVEESQALQVQQRKARSESGPKISVEECGETFKERYRFLEAARNNSLDDVRSWLARGMDVNARNEFGETALHLTEDVEVTRLLISAGADVNARDQDFLMTPIFFQEVPIAKLLVAAGADVNIRSGKGNTPLIWYAYSGYLEGIEYLLSVGADINAINDDGCTALCIAEKFINFSLVDYLKSKGAKGPAR